MISSVMSSSQINFSKVSRASIGFVCYVHCTIWYSRCDIMCSLGYDFIDFLLLLIYSIHQNFKLFIQHEGIYNMHGINGLVSRL